MVSINFRITPPKLNRAKPAILLNYCIEENFPERPELAAKIWGWELSSVFPIKQE